MEQSAMKSTDDLNYANGLFPPILPGKIRWLAGMAGCVAGVALLGLSEVVAFVASFLVLGAALSTWFPRAGRWFILVPALLLSAIILPISIVNFIPTTQYLVVGPHDFNFLAMTLSWLLSPILLIWCIGAVATTFVKLRHGSF
jgi:hypothetical protein